MGTPAAVSSRARLAETAQRLRRWPPKPGVLLFSVTFLILLGWWIAYYPSLFSPDSISYAVQVTKGPWTSDYSVLYNAILWLSFKITGGPSLVTLLQVVGMAGALTYCGTGLLRLGAKWRWVAVVVIGLGAFTAYLSKDVAFTAAELVAFGALMRIASYRMASEAARPPLTVWITLYAGYLFMCLFRDNAPLMVIVGAAILLLALPGLRRHIAIAAVGALATWVIATFGLYPALGVHRANSSLVLGPAYTDIAIAYQKTPKLFNDKDIALMEEETPLRRWLAVTNCYTSDDLDVSSEWDKKAGERNSGELFRLWLKVLQNAPNTVVDARICRGAIAWMPFPPANQIPAVIPAGTNPGNLKRHKPDLPPSVYHSLHADPPIGALRHLAIFYEKATFARSLQFALWRGATWTYVGYFVLLLYMRRRRASFRVPVVLASAILANQIVVFVDNPNQLVRYMLGCLYMGVLLLTLFSVRPREPDGLPAP
jgi:hypothetical protein